MSATAAVPPAAAPPHPHQRYGLMMIRQGNHQELMTKTNFAAIHNQTIGLDNSLGQKLFHNRFVPISHSKFWVLQFYWRSQADHLLFPNCRVAR